MKHNRTFCSWHSEDIECKAKEMNITLTYDEISEVINLIEHNHDANIGVNWDGIEFAINKIKGL